MNNKKAVDTSSGSQRIEEDPKPNMVFNNYTNYTAYELNTAEIMHSFFTPVSPGMSKMELLKTAMTPIWINARLGAFIGLWVLWILLILVFLFLSLYFPSCDLHPVLKWWEKSNFYQIDVKCFKDGNTDSKGDLLGIKSSLEYLENIGVTCVDLSPLYMTTDHDFSISFVEINPSYGTLEDLKSLISSLKRSNISTIMDIFVRCTSDQHDWFKRSIASEFPYKDYYVWASAVEDDNTNKTFPPNDWVNFEGRSAWQWNDERKQFYLYHHSASQPYLNYRNPYLRKEMKKVIDFWLSKELDGLKIMGISSAGKNEIFYRALENNRKMTNLEIYKMGMSYYSPTLEVLKEWKEIFNNYSSMTGKDKYFAIELMKDSSNSSYIEMEKHQIADMVLNTLSAEITENYSAQELFEMMEPWTCSCLPKPGWMIGTRYHKRLATRVGQGLVDAIFTILLLQRGTSFTYYGDELGMEDISPNDTKEELPKPEICHNKQGVMQWNNDANASFTNASDKPVPLNANYYTVNVEAEVKKNNSHLNYYRRLIELKQYPSFVLGSVEYPIISKNIFSFIRHKKGFIGYLIILNIGKEPETLNLSFKYGLPHSAYIECVAGRTKLFKPYSALQLKHVTIPPKVTLVLSFAPYPMF